MNRAARNIAKHDDCRKGHASYKHCYEHALRIALASESNVTYVAVVKKNYVT